MCVFKTSKILLQETGVGKTVNSFRKNDTAGDLAKSLVAQWKKLVPQSAERYVFEKVCSGMQMIATSHLSSDCIELFFLFQGFYSIKVKMSHWSNPFIIHFSL